MSETYFEIWIHTLLCYGHPRPMARICEKCNVITVLTSIFHGKNTTCTSYGDWSLSSQGPLYLAGLMVSRDIQAQRNQFGRQLLFRGESYFCLKKIAIDIFQTNQV